VGEMILGVVVVGLVAGFAVGRTLTKSQRSFADQKSAMATYEKYRKAMFVDTRNAIFAVIIVGLVMFGLFLAVLKSA
jgi:hypothetical protein